MANAIPPVLVELQLETAKIKSQMESVNKNFSDFGDTVKKQTSFLSNFKAAAAGVFAGNVMTQGLQMVKGAIQGAVAEAQEYEKATAQLNAGIVSTGNLAGLSVEGLQAHASALESLSGQDEIAIMKNQALLQTFTNVRNVVGEGNDIFNQASLAVLNMGAKMGGGAGSAMQLGKALNDPLMGMNALRRVGVVFTEEQKESIKTMVASGDIMGAQKVILAELEVEFGGAAKAAGDTFAGSVARAKDKVSDFARDLITNLQPILLKIGSTIGDLWNKYMVPLFRIINDNKEALLAFVAVLGTAYVAFKVYNAIVVIAKTVQAAYAVAQVLMKGGQLATIASTNGLAASMLRLNAIMAANPIGLIVAAVALLAAGFVFAWNKSETFREVVIKVAKAGIIAIGYLIEWVGKLATGVLKVATGPLVLLLKGLALLKVPGAQAALNGITGAIENVGTFFEKTAESVKGYADNLDGLKDKKFKLPGFGGDKPVVDVVVGADLPGGGLTPEQIAAAKANAKEKAKLLASANKDVAKSYEAMNKVIGDARKKSFEIESDYYKEIAKINKQYADKELAIKANYAEKATELEVAADKKRASIIQKSRELLTNAFQSGTKLDLAKLFEDSDKSGAGIVAKLREKYAAIGKLQKAAGALASAGFTQTFIQDVISQGPEAGNAMAAAILGSSPETMSEMQSLFMGIEDISKNGLNTLAEQMSTSTSFATQELVDEYEQVGIELKNALAKNTNDLADALSNNQKELQDALLAAQTAYNDAIDTIEKDTKEKLATLQEELRKTAETIRQLSGAKAGVAALSGSPSAGIIAGTESLGLAGKSSGSLVINNNTTINGTNLTDPQATADTVGNAVRFGMPQGLGLSVYRRVAEK
jgi:hypothetical protein